MEDYQQEQQQPFQQQPQQYQTPMSSYGSSILYLTDPEPILKEIVLTLKSQIKDENGNIVQIGKPLLNDKGINMIINHVRPFVNQMSIMSNLDENEICRLVMFQSEGIILDLMVNKKEYDIESDTQRSTITKAVSVISYAGMKRAIAGSGNEKSFWKGSTQEITMRNPDAQKSKGFWQQMADWG